MFNCKYSDPKIELHLKFIQDGKKKVIPFGETQIYSYNEVDDTIESVESK